MDASDSDPRNPYQSPETAGTIPADATPQDYAQLAKKLKGQILGLGGFWIVLGVLPVSCLLSLLSSSQSIAAGILAYSWEACFIVFLWTTWALVWVVLGVLTCLRIRWAIYVGLAFTYAILALLIGAVAYSNIQRITMGSMSFAEAFAALIPFAMIVAVIVQSHRVLRWMRKLKMLDEPQA